MTPGNYIIQVETLIAELRSALDNMTRDRDALALERDELRTQVAATLIDLEYERGERKAAEQVAAPSLQEREEWAYRVHAAEMHTPDDRLKAAMDAALERADHVEAQLAAVPVQALRLYWENSEWDDDLDCGIIDDARTASHEIYTWLYSKESV